MDMEESDFVYTATFKLAEFPNIRESFPGVTDLAVNSRVFPSYIDCVASVRDFMESVVTKANGENDKQLTVSAEVNPIHTGIETRSKDWGSSELARLWIFDKSEEDARLIQAVAQARVFGCDKGTDPSSLLS